MTGQVSDWLFYWTGFTLWVGLAVACSFCAGLAVVASLYYAIRHWPFRLLKAMPSEWHCAIMRRDVTTVYKNARVLMQSGDLVIMLFSTKDTETEWNHKVLTKKADL